MLDRRFGLRIIIREFLSIGELPMCANKVNRSFSLSGMPKRFTPSRRDQRVPDNLWVQCSDCRELIYRRQLEDSNRVCPRCGCHFRLSAREWIDIVLDDESFRE